MTKEAQILKILNEYKSEVKHGSDGDYDTFFAIDEDDFNEVTNDIMSLFNEVPSF